MIQSSQSRTRQESSLENSQMKNSRIYIVGALDGTTRLARASTPHQAISHVAHSQFTVRVPTQDELIAAVSKGVTVENYKDANQLDLELGAAE
jgi:hypothetical protein